MDIEQYIVPETVSVFQAMQQINNNARGILFVCRDGKLIASISDGDIRRGFLKGISPEETIKLIANYNPYYVKVDEIDNLQEYMKKYSITAVPIVDDNMIIKDIRFLIDKPVSPQSRLRNQVVIMAGGKGSRLKPYTDVLPKPLIPIGEKTIIEHILEQFESFGCKDFNIIVNYKKNLIKAYFTDSEKVWNIKFTEENRFLGTGGGLSLVKGYVKDTFFMSNCDILIQEDYSKILEYHKAQHNIVTLVCAKKEETIPYGTIEISDDGNVLGIKEKPRFSFNTNTGLYVLEPEFLDKIPVDTVIDITDVIEMCINAGEKVGAYIISEDKWMDMGQLDEMEKMKRKLEL